MPEIRIIQSSGSIPTVTQLPLGDIAINSYDGKAYIKQVSGSIQNIIELGTGGASVSASYATSASYSSYAVTASFALNFNPAATASYAVSASSALVAKTASYAFTAVSSSYALTAGTASYVLNAVSASYATNALSSSYALTATTASYALSTLSASFASTASYVNTLNQDVTVNGNLTVTGTASFTYVTGSIVKVGSSTIILNTDYPAIRFGGMTVVDSGSFGNSSTGSLLWDSLENRWIYSNPSGSNYDGGLLISGPRNTSGLGNEQGTTLNALMKGQGGDHITSSGIFEDSSGNVGIGITGSTLAKLQVVGNVYATSFTGSFFGTASNALSSSFATTASYVLNAVSASFATTASYYKTFPYTGSALVTGSLGITGSTSITSGSLSVYKSGSTVVDIQGSQGQLFSIIDALSGSLMSVNDISGLPILEVFSDDRVVMGTYGAPGLTVSGSSIIATGSLFGTASYAVSSSVVYVSNKSTANVDYPLIFKGDSAALDDYRTLAADTAGPYYNPLKNTLGSVSGLIISASSFYGPLTGSVLGTASYADNAKIFPYTGSAIISGSLTVEGNVTVNSATTIDFNTSVLNINAPTIQVPSFGFPYSPSANVRTVMYDAVSNILFVTSSLPGGGGSFTGSFSGSFTGSLLGTASYALYALGAGTANNATSASYALSASYSNTAVSSSYALNATTASYVLNAVSASYSTNALSASYAVNATSASYSTNALSSSYALVSTTASYAVNALSSSYALSGSFSNFALTASYALNAADSVWTGSAGGIFYNGGNVGIGVTNPTYALEVSGSSGNQGIIRSRRLIAYGGTAADPAIATDSTIAGLFEVGYAQLGFSSYAGEAGRIEGASRLWNIGMTGGTAKFNIKGTGTTSSTVSLLVQNSTPTTLLQVEDGGTTRVTGPTPQLMVKVPSNQTPSSVLTVGGSALFTYDGYSNAGGFYIDQGGTSNASRTIWYDGSGTPKNLITGNGTNYITSGNVGIGTTNPGTTLDVVGNIQASNYLYGNVATITPLVLNVTAGDLTVENATVGYNLVLKTSGAERMRVTSVGDVGIGTFSPAAKLEVVGNVKATSFTGSLFGTASYAVYAIGAGAANSATSASYALTASFAQNFSPSATASYALNALSSSYALTATSASYALNALSSSYALSGSFSNFALTASYALNAGDSVWTGSGANIYYNLGNVGIGTTNPAKILDIIIPNSSHADYGIRLNSPGGYGGASLYHDYGQGNGVTVFKIANDYGDARINLAQDAYDGTGSPSSIRFFTAPLGGGDVGVERVRFASTGNVGIGTTNPGAKLDVRGRTNIWGAGTTSATLGLSVLDSPGSNYNFYVEDNGGAYLRGNVRIGNSTDNGYKLDVDGIVNIASSVVALRIGGTAAVGRGLSTDGTRINGGNTDGIEFTANNNNTITTVFRPNGFVGIGTTNPSQRLDVNGALVVGMTTPAPFWNALFKDYNDGSGIYISAVNGGGGKYIAGNGYYYNSTFWWSDKTTASAINLDNGTLIFYTNTGLTPNTNYTPTERMRVATDGNVGIGTATPVRKLHVYGDVQVDTNLVVVSGIYNTNYYAGGATATYFKNSVGADTVAILESGLVGIGTVTPTAKLEVIGNVKATSFTGSFSGSINTAVSASYALSSSYALTATTASYAISALSSSYASTATTASYALNALSSSYALSGSFSNFALTASYALNAADSVWTGSGTNIYYNQGNVGIGTTNPNEKFVVQGNGARIKIQTAGDPAAYYTFLESNYDASNTFNIVDGGSYRFGSKALVTYNDTYINGYYNVYIATGTVTNNSAANIRLFVDQNGNIGIGTTNPTVKLQVDNNSHNYIQVNSSVANVQTAVNVTNSSSTSRATLSWEDGTRGAYADLYSSTYLSITTQSSEKMRITAGGSVGIGTTSPGAELAINSGNSNTRIFVQNAGSTKLEIGYGPTGYGFTHPTGEFIAHSDNLYFGQISSVGTNVTFTTGGAVGIGTTSPSARLHISGSTDATQRIIVAGSGNNSSLHLNYNGSNVGFINSYQNSELNIGTSVSAFVNFYTNNTERMRIAAAGNVGIGIVSPSAKLHVSGSGFYENGSLTVQAPIGYYGIGNPTLALTYAGSLYGSHLIGDAWNYIIDNPYSSTSQGGIELSTQGTTRLTVAKNGNVGIGTTNPGSALDAIVSSGGTSGLRFRGYSDAATPYLLSLGTYSYPDQFQIKSVNGLVTMGIVGNTGANPDLAFQTNTTERMRITTGGNVGIGTTNPGYKLHVYESNTAESVSAKFQTAHPNLNYILLQNGGGSFNHYIQTNSGTLGLSADENGSSGVIQLKTNNVVAVTVNTSQNVGIGTGSPTQKLDVAGAISVSGSVIDYEVAPALIGPGPAVNIVSFVPGTTKAAFVDYVIVDSSGATNQRVGTIMISISLNTVSAVMNEVTTLDIGNTSAITFAVAYGAPTWLTATNSGITPYDISYMVRYF